MDKGSSRRLAQARLPPDQVGSGPAFRVTPRQLGQPLYAGMVPYAIRDHHHALDDLLACQHLRAGLAAYCGAESIEGRAEYERLKVILKEQHGGADTVIASLIALERKLRAKLRASEPRPRGRCLAVRSGSLRPGIPEDLHLLVAPMLGTQARRAALGLGRLARTFALIPRSQRSVMYRNSNVKRLGAAVRTSVQRVSLRSTVLPSMS